MLYINDIYTAISCNAVRLFADDASIISGNRDLQLAKEKTNEMYIKLYRWCLAYKLSINKDKTNFVLFYKKSKPIPENFDCIETENMPMVQYLGLIVDQNLYWNAHVDYVCMSLVKFFGIFNHAKHFSFIYSRINYWIEVYGSCADEHLSKLQVMQNKLLKLLLKLDYRTSTSLLHYNMTILKCRYSYCYYLILRE